MKLWNAETGEVLTTLAGHHGAMCSVILSSDGKARPSESEDTTAKL